MQILVDRNGIATVKLTQLESRRMRDAAHIANRIAANIDDDELIRRLRDGAASLLAVAKLFAQPATVEKQDVQDDEAPGFNPPQ